MFTPQLAMWEPSLGALLVILVLALLLFGRRLPEVGRNLGRGLVEFKKGLKDVTDELDEVKKDVNDAAAKSDAKPSDIPKGDAKSDQTQKKA